MAITVAPLTTTVMTSIDDERHAGAASGINNAVARAAGLLAIAVFGAVAVFVFARELDRQLVARHASAETRRAAAAQASHLADAKLPADLMRVAFARAFRVDMFAGAALAVASALGALMITPASNRRTSAD